MSYVPSSGQLVGLTPQAKSTASKTLSSTGQTTVVNVTEGGMINFIYLKMTTGMGVTTAGVDLKFTVDGATASSLTVMNGSPWVDWVLACTGSGDGTTTGDYRLLPISITYKTSLKVEIDCTVSSLGAGTMEVTVVRSKKV